jgi:putative aminopeptidase FrvX
VAEFHEFPHGLVVDPRLVDLMIETAEEEGIPYQLEILEDATTCATAIQQALGGAVSGALSIPTRYLHCPIEVVDINDALATSNLAVATINRITSKYVNNFYSH